MVSATTLRTCSVCLTRRPQQPQRVQQKSISNFAKPPRRGPLAPWKGFRRRNTNNNNSCNTPRSSAPSSLRSLRTFAGQRRNATLAGNSNATTMKRLSQQPRSYRKEITEILSEMLGKPRTLPIPRWVTPKYYSITLSECFGHASFILVAISYAVDDFLWLRIIAVAGSTSMLFFTYFHPHGKILWLPFKWNCLFIAINSYRIGKVFWDRYLAEQLSNELMQTRSKHFYLMDPVDFGRLARAGTIETYKKGDVIIQQDQPNSHVWVVLSGGLKVMRDDQLTYTLEEGNFIAESGLHAGLMLSDTVDSCCKIVAESEVRLLAWDRTDLMDLLHRSPHLRRALKAVLSWDIVRKLKNQRILLSSGVIHDAEAWTRRRNEQTEHRYNAILKNLLSSHSNGMSKRKKELDKYRTIHHIDDEHHREALKECGWTVEEFEEGFKNDSPSDQHSKKRHGPEWYVREMIMRIVG